VTLDENFLVLNRRNVPRSTDGLSGFHLYGSDVCLHALSSGGSAYVIDFPISHVGRLTQNGDYPRAYWQSYELVKNRFMATWSDRYWFCYVVTPVDTLFISRSRILRRVFGSTRAVAAVQQRRQQLPGSPLRRIDRIPSLQFFRAGHDCTTSGRPGVAPTPRHTGSHHLQ
jgi:hypothetical protein